ncbi:MAG: PD-(D/E)XK nuclease family protein, partial [Candidatus Riflebacteria bacterium]|nr:PD-(D/E)XK nuclease family protein [Candidatus Riflebacteria bacterium]
MADDKIVEKVKKLLTEEEAINKATAKDFNIYRILGIESKETLICRAIAALLDDNYHNQGDCFLKLFFEQVLNREYTKKAYQIITEYYIDSGRRIDIAIKSKENETEKEFIPIEVKIFAGDQKNQCYDYCSCKENNEKKIYYLTLDGRLPSEYSVSSINPIKDREEKVIGYEGVECISFEKH